MIEAGGEAEPIRRASSTYSMPSMPRYEPHLNLRMAAASTSALSVNTNGTLPASGSSGSLSNAIATSTTPSPDRGMERRSLEEDGTVITL